MLFYFSPITGRLSELSELVGADYYRFGISETIKVDVVGSDAI